MSLSSTCELCRAALMTMRYFEDKDCWIADCLICQVPMVVWREHDASPSPEIRGALLASLSVVAEDFYRGREWYYDDHMRKIPDHYHAHARAK